jgi:hypothetical protein
VDVEVGMGDGIAVGVEVFVLVAGGVEGELTANPQAVNVNIKK